jgi:FixJ family two-component response regulator
MFTSPAMSDATPIVFVVDDDDAVRRALTRLIRSAGYSVECFGSAREFLEASLSHRVAPVLYSTLDYPT